jgi:hypothetical protein
MRFHIVAETFVLRLQRAQKIKTGKAMGVLPQ